MTSIICSYWCSNHLCMSRDMTKPTTNSVSFSFDLNLDIGSEISVTRRCKDDDHESLQPNSTPYLKLQTGKEHKERQQVSRDMTKPTKWLCTQWRLRSAWASAQSYQTLRCPHEESLDLYLPIKRTAKSLIRLGRCPGWSESSLGTHSFCWFCHVAAHI